MTNEDALRAVRPRVAEWIDKLRHGGDVVFVPKEDLQLAHEVSALRSACASAISGNSDDAIAGDCSEECRIGRIALDQKSRRGSDAGDALRNRDDLIKGRAWNGPTNHTQGENPLNHRVGVFLWRIMMTRHIAKVLYSAVVGVFLSTACFGIDLGPCSPIK
jgi:hypothetical protein